MKHALLALLFAASTACAQIKISQLPSASTLTGAESTMVTQGGVSKAATITQINAFTLTSTGTLTGKTISGANNTFSAVPFSALNNLPSTLAGHGITDGLTAAAAATTYAPIASPTFTGTVTAPTFVGTFTGNASTSTTATSFSGSLVGDVTGTQGATVVSSVNGVSAANVAAGATLANAAVSANTANAIVKRDASGNFSAGTITAALAGNASTVTTNANLTGPVTSIGNATAIANGAISNAMLANSAVASLSGTNTGDQDLSSYLTSATAASTYATISGLALKAPIASPTFTGTVTIPSGASISGYLTTATAASTYEPVQTAASQAEAEAGTETAIRKFSPLRVKQAITALSGGGGGASIVRSAGVLQGYTVAPVAASAPPNLTYTFAGGPDSEWTASYTYNGTGYSFTAAAADPMNGSVWIDTSSGTWDEATSANALSSAISALELSSTGSGSDYVEVSMALTGAAYSHSGALDYGAGSAVSGGGSGTDAVPGEGHVSEVTIIAQDGTKTIKPLRVGVSGAGVSATVQFALKVGGTYYPIAADVASDTLNGEPAVSTFFPEMISGRASASLVARMTTSVPTGGSITCWGIVQQN